MTDEELESIQKFFCRHLVVLACTSVELDENGNEKGKETFFHFTGTVLKLEDTWYIATAGHIFDTVEKQIAQRKVKVLSQSLADYFGHQASTQLPIPFDFIAAKKVWKYERGLDFALIPLSPLFQRTLQENRGVVPFVEKTWTHPADVEFYQYRLLGCPDYLRDSNRMASDQPLTGFVKPMFPCVDRVADDTREDYPRFAGLVQKGLDNVEGMSGGPIMGIAQYKGQHLYWLLALQSKWNSTTRHVYGCPLPVLMPIARKMLDDGIVSAP